MRPAAEHHGPAAPASRARGHLHHPAADRRGGPADRGQHVTFSIFFLSRGWPGATPRPRGALRRAPPTRRTVHLTARAARLQRPAARAVRALAQGRLRRRATTTPGPASSTARRRASATRSSTSSPVLPELLDRLPVTLSLAVGAAVIWLLVGVAIGVISALRRGTVFDRGAMASRWPASRSRSSSPAWSSLDFFSYTLGRICPRRHVHALHREPGQWALRPDPALDHAGLPVRRRVRPAHPGRHARDHERGLHPHRPGQGPARAHGRPQARPARRADPDPHHLRPRPRPAARRRRSSPRRTFSLPGLGKYAVEAITNNDLPE